MVASSPSSYLRFAVLLGGWALLRAITMWPFAMWPAVTMLVVTLACTFTFPVWVVVAAPKFQTKLGIGLGTFQEVVGLSLGQFARLDLNCQVRFEGIDSSSVQLRLTYALGFGNLRQRFAAAKLRLQLGFGEFQGFGNSSQHFAVLVACFALGMGWAGRGRGGLNSPGGGQCQWQEAQDSNSGLFQVFHDYSPSAGALTLA